MTKQKRINLCVILLGCVAGVYFVFFDVGEDIAIEREVVCDEPDIAFSGLFEVTPDESFMHLSPHMLVVGGTNYAFSENSRSRITTGRGGGYFSGSIMISQNTVTNEDTDDTYCRKVVTLGDGVFR